MKRHCEALIINDGAVNPLPITRALHDAAVEAMGETRSTDDVWQDAAICLMLNQIAHMAGMPSEMSFERYRQAVEECQRRKDEPGEVS
jgi:DNA invertase Pin-like site-specific DNA recombinase